MATRDLRSYFQVKSKAPTNTTPDLVRVSQNITLKGTESCNLSQKRGKYASNIPPHVKVEIGKYALCNAMKGMTSYSQGHSVRNIRAVPPRIQCTEYVSLYGIYKYIRNI